MPTTNTRLGMNSWSISYRAGTSAIELLLAVKEALLAQGWTLFDDAAGANAKCFRAQIYDGTMAYKYLVVDLNTAGYLLPKVYEAWNATTHAGTNLAGYSDTTSYNQQITLANGGMLWVFANARYALFYSRTASLSYGAPSGASFSGCIEVTRDNQDEVSGVTPTFGWINGSLALGSGSTQTSLHCFSPPRNKGGEIGTTASAKYSLSTVMGRTHCVSGVASGIALGGMLPVVGPNPLSLSGNFFAFTPTLVECQTSNSFYATSIRGRLFGIKILGRNAGTPGDTLTVKVDSLLFTDTSSTGTLLPHMIVGEAAYNGRFALPL